MSLRTHAADRKGTAPVLDEPALGVAEGPLALTGRDRPLRGAGPSPLRDDLDHPVGGFGPVEGRCRRPLDDLDALDLFGVDVVQAAEDGAAEPLYRDPGVDGVVHPDPVDVDEGLGAEREAGNAPDPDLGTRSHLGGGGPHLDPGGPPHDVGRDVGNPGDLGDVLGLDRCDRVPDLPARLRTHRARHHDLVDADGRLGKGDTDVHVTGPDLPGDRPVPDAGESKRDLRRGQGREVKRPCTLVAVATLVPSMDTRTPERGWPPSSTTTPGHPSLLRPRGSAKTPRMRVNDKQGEELGRRASFGAGHGLLAALLGAHLEVKHGVPPYRSSGVWNRFLRFPEARLRLGSGKLSLRMRGRTKGPAFMSDRVGTPLYTIWPQKTHTDVGHNSPPGPTCQEQGSGGGRA
jgi:hypothetical protein